MESDEWGKTCEKIGGILRAEKDMAIGVKGGEGLSKKFIAAEEA